MDAGESDVSTVIRKVSRLATPPAFEITGDAGTVKGMEVVTFAHLPK
jgi:hypothetical protein